MEWFYWIYGLGVRIEDIEVLKGLAQPVRQRLYRLLTQIGPVTGGTLASKLGLDPGQCSYHLRELARRGLIEDVPELARDRRERWWRTVRGATAWSTLDFPGPEGRAVTSAIKAQVVRDEFERVRRFEQQRERFDAGWQSAAMSSDSFLKLTAPELAELTAELQQVLERWARDTREKPIDDERKYVFLFLHAFPEETA